MTGILKFIVKKNSNHDDELLIEGCLKQDRRSQELLYKKYSKRMFGVCLGYAKDHDSAKEILQESFIKVFNKIKDYKSEGSLEGWIRRLVVNTAIDHHRKSSRLYVSNMGDERIESVENEVLEQFNSEELLDLIRKLPEGYRVIFNLSVVEGYSHEEIGEQLGITPSTSRSQLARARKLLQEWILERSNVKSDIRANAR